MNVTCGNCGAKYAVPDEKVRGRKVKIGCKRCRGSIIVDGTQAGTTASVPPTEAPTTAAPAASPTPAPAPSAAAPAGGPDSAFTRARAAASAPVAPAAAPAAAAPRPGGAGVKPGKQTMLGGLRAPGAQGATSAATPAAPTATPVAVPAPPAALMTPVAARTPGPAQATAPSAAQPKRVGKQTIMGGLQAPTAGPAAERATAPKPAPAPPSPPAEALWTVAVTDDDHREIGVAELVELFIAGKIDHDTFVWRDGMADWLTPFEVPELDQALRARGVLPRDAQATDLHDVPTTMMAAPSEQAAPPPGVQGAWHEPGGIKFEDATVSIGGAQAAGRLRTSPGESSGAGAPELFGAQAADAAFGGLMPVGDDESPRGAPASEAPSAMTGARNESSVLFSLDSLTKAAAAAAPSPTRASPSAPTPRPPRKKKTDDVDLMALSAGPIAGGVGDDDAPDSLLRLGGTGLTSALAAPDFSAPYVEPKRELVAQSQPMSVLPVAKRGGSGGMFTALALLVVLGAAGAAIFILKPPFLFKSAAPAASAVATREPAGAKVAALASTAAPTQEVAASASALPAASASAAPAASGKKPDEKKPDEKKPDEKKPDEAKPDEKKPDEAKPETAPATLPPFDQGAARAALGAAAGSAGSCKKDDGPTGSGRVSVTFAPSGRATNAVVTGELAGTAVGGCVARIFRSARVPPFSGDPVTVGKSFSVN